MSEIDVDRLRFFLQRFVHLRVMVDPAQPLELYDVRDRCDGQVITIAYARNAEIADEMNRTFEQAREILRGLP